MKKKTTKLAKAGAKLTDNEVTAIMSDVHVMIEEALAAERTRIAAYMAKVALERVRLDPNGSQLLIEVSDKIIHNKMPDEPEVDEDLH